MPDNPQLCLAAQAASWKSALVGDNTRQAVRHAILDWFATTLAGRQQRPARLLLDVFQDQSTASGAICYIDNSRKPPRTAALLNATSSHIVEFDDIFRDGGYHPGSPTISAALALAQYHDLSLDDLHRAIIGGYEVGCRISLAIQPSHYEYWHTTSTVGTIGAAVACALLLDCDVEVIAHAISLATSFAGGHQQNLSDVGMAKALHAGHAAEAGMLAAFAAARGMTGSVEALHGRSGFAAATSNSCGDWAAALEGLGKWTPIERITVKNHGCCGHIFPSIDGLRVLRAQAGFNNADISSIHVSGYGATKRMCDRSKPETAQEARFSVQYCLAADLLLGNVRLRAFDDDALANKEIRALMQVIAVEEDATLSDLYPRQRMARIKVTLRDGRVFERLQETRKGDPEDPLGSVEIAAKFDELAGSVLSGAAATDLKQALLHGNELPGPLIE
ncbi:MmgE/PrpD family protein [Rhizobium sp. RCC_161_2]|uniref:MmgE/PrpD family protein n=1 Tax=Rhizobium sp. RCC_161_2 TaxID=3239219 RepID=UPI0035253164